MNQSRNKDRPVVLYEDKGFVVVLKEREELTVPGRGPHMEDCLMSRTSLYYNQVFNVHRLDQPTSGLVLIALTKEMQRLFSILFLNRKIRKEYVALVDGRLPESEGRIELPLRGDMENRPLQIVDHEKGKRAVTHWSVLAYEGEKTRVLLVPETGRTHQLRVHLQTIGYPISGDRLYNPHVPADLMGELKLHALSLDFEHPETGKRVYVKRDPDF